MATKKATGWQHTQRNGFLHKVGDLQSLNCLVIWANFTLAVWTLYQCWAKRFFYALLSPYINVRTLTSHCT